MRIYEDIDVSDFRDRAWSSAVDTLDVLTDEQVETIFSYLEDTNGEEGMDLTDLNDFFRFEEDTIAEWLGFSSWEALEKSNNGEEDEEDDDSYTEEEDNFIKITHGEPGVDDTQSIDDMLFDFMQICDGAYTVFDDTAETYSEETETYGGSAEASVSDAMLDYLKEHNVSFVETV